MNMDFSQCHGINRSNIDGIKKVINFYNVNCIHCVNFEKRVRANPNYLSFPFDDIQLVFAIGEFHINGHIPKCFPRYSPHFVEDAAVNDGKILESLWAGVDEIFPSSSASSLPNRTEALDDHFNSSNFRKGTGIGTSSPRQFPILI